jgi:outer membrane protein assembly complex protein YaeT
MLLFFLAQALRVNIALESRHAVCAPGPTRETTFRRTASSLSSAIFWEHEEMRIGSLIAVSFLGLLVVASAFATPQTVNPSSAITTRSSYRPPPGAVIDEIKFVGLHRIATETAKSRLPFQPGEEFDSARIAAALRALNRLGWFEDVYVEAEESHSHPETAVGIPQRVQLEFRFREYPPITDVDYSGSRILSPQQIRKLLEDKRLSPEVGSAANPVNLHRVAVAIRSELAGLRYPDARVLIVEEQSGPGVRVGFQIHDGPQLRVVGVSFSGHPTIPEKVLRKQMRQVSPDAWFSGFRNKNVYTREKGEEDRLNLLTYLHNHGFPQAGVGIPEVSLVHALSGRTLPWFHRLSEPGLMVGVPIDTGPFYTFSSTEISASLRQKLGSARNDLRLSDVIAGHSFSELAVESQRRTWEMQLHRIAQRQNGRGDYRLRAIPTFDDATHTVSVKFDFDSVPLHTVRRIEFRGNQRFPDRYLRRRIGLSEGEPLDEYKLEAGIARLTRTGYFQPLKREDVQIETHEAEGVADVSIQLHEKGKQRVAFSGGPGQFGSTLGIAYIVFNMLGMDEFLSTQIDGGPESLQLAISLTKEGFLGSRGTLALSVFDTFLRPRFTTGAQAPFQRTQTESVNAGWNYAASDVDSIAVNFGHSRSLNEYRVNPPSSATALGVAGLQSETSSNALGIGWTHYSGEQKIQLSDSVSGGWLGGNENLLKSKVEYGHIFPDKIFDRQNAWAFRTTMSAVDSYDENMPVYARFFSGDDLVRGLGPGELGPYGTLATVSPSGATTYSAVPTGASLIGAANLEFRFHLTSGVEGATFFDAGSGFLLPRWSGQTGPALINSTNGLFHGSTGLEVRWTLPVVGVPLRMNYAFNILRLNRALFMPDGSVFRLHNRLGVLGWGLGPLF